MTIRRSLPLTLVALSGLALLSGCDEGGLRLPQLGGDTAQATPASDTEVQLVERDVEAPEVFQQTDRGLWDGRPSLGGIWVAHPDVRDPERVIIRNQDNGKFVIGALFRKEAATPGPKFQISSEAAGALGMLAGAPATLNVTALRREEAPAETAPAPAPAEAPTAAPTAEVSTTELPADAPAPAPAPAPAASSLDKPFVQIGIFSVEANARRTASQLEGAGLSTRITESQLSGKSFWRVIAGPAATEAARATLLEQVKAQGFTDAYFVRN